MVTLGASPPVRVLSDGATIAFTGEYDGNVEFIPCLRQEEFLSA